MPRQKHPITAYIEGLSDQQHAKALRSILKIKDQVIRRHMRRYEQRLLRERSAGVNGPPKRKPPKKPAAHEILALAAQQNLAERFRQDPAKTRAEQLRHAAREAGVTVEKLKRVLGILAALQVQELVTSGSLVLPRIGRLRLVESPERLRKVNVSGRVGRDGKLGLVKTRPVLRPRFTAAASLRRAIQSAEDLHALVTREVTATNPGDAGRPEAFRRMVAFQSMSPKEAGPNAEPLKNVTVEINQP